MYQFFYYCFVFSPNNMIGRLLTCDRANNSVINLTILNIDFYYKIQVLAYATFGRINRHKCPYILNEIFY